MIGNAPRGGQEGYMWRSTMTILLLILETHLCSKLTPIIFKNLKKFFVVVVVNDTDVSLFPPIDPFLSVPMPSPGLHHTIVCVHSNRPQNSTCF